MNAAHCQNVLFGKGGINPCGVSFFSRAVMLGRLFHHALRTGNSSGPILVEEKGTPATLGICLHV